MREMPLPRPISRDPLLEHDLLDPAHSLHFRDAGVGDAVHVPLEERHLVFGSQVPVVGHALVVVVRHEVEDVLFQVRAGADDRVNLARTDHGRERDPELRRGHRACKRHEHLAARLDVVLEGLRGIEERRRVEMPEVARNVPRHRPLRPRQGRIACFWKVLSRICAHFDGFEALR